MFGSTSCSTQKRVATATEAGAAEVEVVGGGVVAAQEEAIKVDAQAEVEEAVGDEEEEEEEEQPQQYYWFYFLIGEGGGGILQLQLDLGKSQFRSCQGRRSTSKICSLLAWLPTDTAGSVWRNSTTLILFLCSRCFVSRFPRDPSIHNITKLRLFGSLAAGLRQRM